jgi:nucleotide-binding universal stress UspA family protein
MGTIVVGVDGSDTAAVAARVAADLASALGKHLHVVTAYDRTGGLHVAGGPAHPGTTSALDQAEGVLAIIASELRPRAKDVTTSAVAGKAPDVICEEAQREDADLIVVGNKRMHGPTKVLGAVAAKVASHAPCDVYIAHTT